MVDRIWNENNSELRPPTAFNMSGAADSFIRSLADLPVATDFQRALKTEILSDRQRNCERQAVALCAGARYDFHAVSDHIGVLADRDIRDLWFA